jgi:nitroreductase
MTNETLQTIINRRSTREFPGDTIPVELLEQLIYSASSAPSPFNNQPWQFIVLTNKRLIQQIATHTAEKIDAVSSQIREEAMHDYLLYRKNALFFADTGALIIVLMKPLLTVAKKHFWGIDDFFNYESTIRCDIMSIGAACQNIMLAAESIGLSTCLMHYPLIANEEVRKLLNINNPWEITAFIPVGIKKTMALPPKRRQFSKIARFITEDTTCQNNR